MQPIHKRVIILSNKCTSKECYEKVNDDSFDYLSNMWLCATIIFSKQKTYVKAAESNNTPFLPLWDRAN